MKRAVVGLVALAFTCASVVACSGSQDQDTRPWKLTWSDEFDGASVDTTKWTIETGIAFGTQQKDFDTDRPENIALKDDMLVFTARKEAFQGNDYTSGRMKSAGKITRQFGRFEARLKIPRGQGMWPAFWLLGDDYDTAGWPACGEIDVMENRGADVTTVHGSIHGPGYFGGSSYTQAFKLDGTATFSDDFHVFAIEWEQGVIRWYVDDVLYQTRSADTLPRSKSWVFDRPFYMILDLAVGGQYGGDPDDTTVFPQTMLVDYVRIYERE